MAEKTGFGAYLRACREAQRLSVEDISDSTRITPRVIRALEDERFEELAAAVYVRGFIRAYCERVGVPTDHALSLYDARRPSPKPAAPAVVAVPSFSHAVRRPRARVLRVALAAGVLALALGLGLHRVAPVAGIRGRSGDATGNGDAAVSRVPEEPGSRAVASTGARVLVIRAEDTTWVRVKPDDARASEEILQPGSVREFRSTGRFAVTLGNAGGVRLELDGKVLPALGRRGQVVRDVVIPRESEP